MPLTLTRRPVVIATLALLLQLVLVIVGAHIANVSPLARNSYVRFDSQQYLSIATGGYRIAYCAPDNSHTIPIVGTPRPGGTGVYCGNAAWFPGYSYLIRGVSLLGIDTVWAGMVCSWALRWLGLWAIASWLRRSQVEQRTSMVTMVAAAAFPGNIYYVAIFPLALTVLTLMLCIDAARRENFGLACAAALGTSLSYATGWLGPTAVAGYLLLIAVKQRRLRTIALSAAIVASALGGVLAVFAIQYWQTGVRQAYFLQRTTFEHTFGVDNLVTRLGNTLMEIVSHPASVDTAKDWQSLVVVAWIAASAIVVFRRARTVDRTVTICLATSLGCWTFPKSMGVEGDLGQVRYESLLLPLLSAFPMLPRSARELFTAAFLVLAPLTTALFFLKSIV